MRRRIACAVAGTQRQARVYRKKEKGQRRPWGGKTGAVHPKAALGTVWLGDVPHRECALCPPGNRLFAESAFSPMQWARTARKGDRACLRCRPGLMLPKGTKFCRKCEKLLPLNAFEHETRRRLHGGYKACVECSTKNEKQTERQTFFKLAPSRRTHRKGQRQ